ncbi:hypothetical protein BaRGS_00034181 [Batillaria attramentaria]|uniref:Uncharacterized protein n=1 Tax=Batillaria attramentaria TaxID=370345 RepID=A0ABD0JI26_9CAEN
MKAVQESQTLSSAVTLTRQSTAVKFALFHSGSFMNFGKASVLLTEPSSRGRDCAPKMGYTTSPLDKVESLSAKQSHSPQSRVTFRKAESLIRHRKVESLFAKQSHSDLRNVESAGALPR